MNYEGDEHTDCDLCIYEIPWGLLKGLEDLEIREQELTIQTTTFIKISWNTKKGPGDLKRLAVTSERPSAKCRVNTED